MRRHVSTVDNETGMNLVLSECSYNMACFWLEEQFKKPLKTETIDSRYTRIIYPKREFIYDEERGYLLGE